MRRVVRGMPAICLVLASGMALLFLVAHLAGLREQVGILSGTLPASRGGALLGVGYVLSWFGAVLLAPILALAAVLRVVAHSVAVRLRRRSAREPARARASAIAARQP